MYKWYIRQNKVDFDSFANILGVDKVTVRIMANRGLENVEDMRAFLEKDASMIRNYQGLPDIDKAVELIEDIRINNKKIRIIGDYDIDGVCSTSILLKGLKALNINVDAKIPHRVEDGYGLNINLINMAIEDGMEAVITCDNGISAFDAIAKAKENNMTVIVTDHHEVPTDLETNSEIIPPADACVNPKLKVNTYPEREICGAHVAFKLVCALGIIHPDLITEELLLELEELSAFATVGDVMPLFGENRGLVGKGLSAMNNSRNLGLRTLIDNRELKDKKINTYHIGYVLGPCINATGRLDSAQTALTLLNTSDEDEARRISERLVEINNERKEITEQYENKAIEILENKRKQNGGKLIDKVIVEYIPDCHESIAGIIAGRVKDKYNRPAIILTKGNGCLKGSARSIEDFNIKENIEKCKDILLHFGGHKLAAGLSLEEDKLPCFKQRINDNASLTEEDFVKKMYIDAPMPLKYASVKLLKEFEKLEPFGSPNTKPYFAIKEAQFISGTVYEKNKKFARYTVMENGIRYTFMLWDGVDEFNEYVKDLFGEESLNALYHGIEIPNPIFLSILYRPNINEYNGRESVQFVIDDYCQVKRG